MSEHLAVSYTVAGEVRLTAELRPEEARWGAYVRGLSADGARALAAELLQAADEADADGSAGPVRPDEEPSPDGDPDTRCGDPHRTKHHGVARCSRGLGHVGVHAGHADDGTTCQWPAE